jgi:hypothetical protein
MTVHREEEREGLEVVHSNGDKRMKIATIN